MKNRLEMKVCKKILTMVKMIYRMCLLVKNRFIKILVILLLIFTSFLVIKRSFDVEIVNLKQLNELETNVQYDVNYHKTVVAQYYERRKNWKTSNLGSILFKNIEAKVYENVNNVNKTFTIVVWKYWNWLKNRHILNFGSQSDPLYECSVKNCKFLPEEHINTADAVLIHMQRGKGPIVKNRNMQQRWVFLSDESPNNTFSLTRKKPNLREFANIFNWTMNYRSDSDIPVPYGRTLPLQFPVMKDLRNVTQSLAKLVPHWEEKQNDVLVAILLSNCGVKHRWYYLNELKQHIHVNVHGKCSTASLDSCPGGFRADCKVMSQYLFYLVFENSLCRQYLTEKAFYNAYSKGAIPVILGPPLKDCNLLLPPKSFLHVDNYKTPAELAEDIIRISKSKERLLSFHRWRNHFEVANEHGFFGSRSYHYCRICEALNYNDNETKIYNFDDLRLFFDPRLTCIK